MAYSRSVLGGSDEDYSRSVPGGSDEDYSRSLLGGSEEYFSRTLLGGSDEVHEIHCEPCKKDGNTVDAVKHCLDCSEYLCAQCFKSHIRFKAFENHVTNDVGNLNPVINKPSAETVSKSVEALPKLHIDHKSEQQSSRPTNAKSSKKPNRKVKAELVSTIDVRTSGDKQDPYIYDLTIVHTYYCVVNDNKNKSVKVVDTRRKCVVSEVHISEAERLDCITSVSDGEVAVTVKIQGVSILLFLSVSTSGIISNTGRAFGIEHGYNGIIHHNDHFYATWVNTIDIFSMRGRILKQIRNNSFGTLYGIALSNDHNTIYVCSFDPDTVLSMDLEGNIKTSYKDEELKLPSGVTVDSKGYVYVCSSSRDCVHQFTADLKVQVIIRGVHCRRCTFYKAENMLCVNFIHEIKICNINYE